MILPAAEAFCLSHAHVLCESGGETAAKLTPERAAFLNAVALLAAEGFADDTADIWSPSGPDSEGDCEDKALWAAQVIARRHPELRASMAAVLFLDGARAHMVLAVFTDRGVLLIDGANYAPRLTARADLATRSGYPGQVYIASNGVGREWTPWN
jgi:predicted transglutaminase-like cysteine proteinase